MARAKLSEFELIHRCFAPLARSEASALGLMDDAAVLAIRKGHELVVTTDTIVAGVHYLPADAPETVGVKALAVNLSDLAAMGATPRGYTLAATFDREIDAHWIDGFARGLARMQRKFKIPLIGGDTAATPGPTTFTVTALGTVARGRALTRGGARAGDIVYVSGALGDGALGLMVAQGKLKALSSSHRRVLLRRYREPVPRVALGAKLFGIARSAVDVSDGLVADLGHICEASGVAAEIAAARVPLSAAGRAAVRADVRLLAAALTGGDDYELVFTVPPARKEAVERLSRSLGLRLTPIGRIIQGGFFWGIPPDPQGRRKQRLGQGGNVRVLDAAGRPMRLAQGGYRHKWGLRGNPPSRSPLRRAKEGPPQETPLSD